MLVKYWMRKAVITVNANDSMVEAVTLMKEYFAPLLPVLKDGQLVGVVTDRDLKRASPSDTVSLDIHELMYMLSKVKVGDIMTKDPITVPEDYTLEETAALLLKYNISSAPVLDNKAHLMGTISQREIFKALISLTGLEKGGIQFAFQVEDRPGALQELTDVVKKYDCRLVSVLTSSERAPTGYRHAYIRVHETGGETIHQMLGDFGDRAKLLYLVDQNENRREEYSAGRRIE